jgi:hypothetical protein
MKRPVLFLFALLTALAMQAQITLTSASVANVGATFVTATDFDLPPGFSIGPPGTAQIWDFSQLNQDDYDTISFIDPATTPYGADFPSANRAVMQGGALDGYAYFELTASSFSLLGFAADPFQTGTPFVIYQNPPQVNGVFPFTYGDSFGGTSSYSVTLDGATVGLPVDSVRFTSTVTNAVTGDAWGDLTLWGGTYACLRTKDIVTTNDVIEAQVFGFWAPVEDTTYTDSIFRWFDNTKGYILAEARYIAGVLEEIEYVDPNPVAIDPAYLAAIQVFPNPASERVIVQTELSEVKTVELYNLQGQRLRTVPSSPGRTEIPLQDIAPGVILVQCLNSEGVALRSQKIVVR